MRTIDRDGRKEPGIVERQQRGRKGENHKFITRTLAFGALNSNEPSDDGKSWSVPS